MQQDQTGQPASRTTGEEAGWLEATIQFINVSEEDRASFAAECVTLGAVGSAEAPRAPATAPDDPGACRSCGSSTRQIVYFPGSMDMEPVLGLLDRQISLFFRRVPDFQARVLQCRRIERQDWGTDWMLSFPSERIGRRLWTVPPWEDAAALPPGALPILIEPGMAFGTGKHATTRHCLEFLEEIASDRDALPRTFLDAGCGSGILSIAACLLGAVRVTAVEVDPDAVRAARKNLDRNGLGGRIQLVNGPLACCRGRFELIAANLTAPTLSIHAPLLASLLREAGLCILSGIQLPEKPGILGLFRDAGLDPLREKVDDREEWSTLLMRKSGGPER